mmetsp:Transcript_4585/g.12184  ORF Transcript_4585/g.12184 Transcript_4585/m.12184 type:complete len:212 (-) Transcript_4585:745-1380(-)
MCRLPRLPWQLPRHLPPALPPPLLASASPSSAGGLAGFTCRLRPPVPSPRQTTTSSAAVAAAAAATPVRATMPGTCRCSRAASRLCRRTTNCARGWRRCRKPMCSFSTRTQTTRQSTRWRWPPRVIPPWSWRLNALRRPTAMPSLSLRVRACSVRAATRWRAYRLSTSRRLWSHRAMRTFAWPSSSRVTCTVRPTPRRSLSSSRAALRRPQ